MSCWPYRADYSMKIRKTLCREGASRFLKWLLTWPKISFLVVNITLFVLAIVPTTLILDYIAAKLLILTLVIPISIWLIIDMWYDRCRYGTISTVLRISLMVAMLLTVVFFSVLGIFDVFHKPVYITGKVESLSVRYRRPTSVDLEGDDQRYTLYQFKIEAEPGKTYLFRFMPNSRNLIPIEELSDSEITED